MPKGLHNALQWNKCNPYLESDDFDDVVWQIVEPTLHKKTTGTQRHGGENVSDTLKIMPHTESSNSELPHGEERLCILKRVSLNSPNNKQKEEKVTSSSLPGP